MGVNNAFVKLDELVQRGFPIGRVHVARFEGCMYVGARADRGFILQHEKVVFAHTMHLDEMVVRLGMGVDIVGRTPAPIGLGIVQVQFERTKQVPIHRWPKEQFIFNVRTPRTPVQQGLLPDRIGAVGCRGPFNEQIVLAQGLGTRKLHIHMELGEPYGVVLGAAGCGWGVAVRMRGMSG